MNLHESAPEQRRPNIVLILADDLGFSDIGCFGGEMRTPALDALASGGVRMTQFYTTPRCSPSRASLLTGRHPHQAGIGVLTRPDLPHGYAGDLSPDVPTLAEILSENGWATWLSGKWHLSADVTTVNGSWPTRRGFDKFFGTLAGCSSYFSPQTLTRGEESAADATDPAFYYTDAISDQAASWIEEQAQHDGDTPFFLYLPYTAPHWPLHARESDIAATLGRFDEGWDQLRRARLERLVVEGLVAPGTELSARDESQPEWVDAVDKEWQVRRMEVYAAQIEAMDRGVATVVDTLKATGVFEDTLILFLSDNGGCAEELPIGCAEDFAAKDAVLRNGTRDGKPIMVGNSSDIDPGPEDTYASYGVPWANLSNAPFRLYKRWVHEGGISSAFIAHWPNGGLNRGSVSHVPYQQVSVLPTILEAASLPFPTTGALEGASMLSTLRGAPTSPQALYWEHIGNAAVRQGDYKLVRDHPGSWELYNIGVDRAETRDLAEDNPELVEELERSWTAWAKRVGVIDWDHMLETYSALGRSAESAEE